MDQDPWKEVKDGLDKWLKITCYLAFIKVFFYILQFLPMDIADRIVEGILGYIGI